jgi:hypothetical protein
MADEMVKMQLGSAVVDVPAAKVERYKAQGFVVLKDGKRLPYVPTPKADVRDGCC